MRRFLAMCVVAAAFCGAAPASAQDATGEAFAAYALDFCASLVDGERLEAAHAAASPNARVAGPQAAGDDVDIAGHDLEATRETPIVILGPPENARRTLMAFARADATRCMTFAGRGEDSLVALRGRLTAEDSPWQAQMAVANAEMFQRNASNGQGGLTLIVVGREGNRVARVIVERTDKTITLITAEQRTAWATHIVAQCAAGVHRGAALTAEAFAPFFKTADRQADSLTLDETPGQPGGLLFLNSPNRNACTLAVASGGVPDLERALIAALISSGATAQGSGTFVWRKPAGAAGSDAIFAVDRSAGPLLMRVYPR